MTTFDSLPRRKLLGMMSASAAASLLTTTACGAGSAHDQLDVWTLEDEVLNPVTQRSLDRFNENSEVQAALTTESNDGFRDAVHVAIDTPQRPDVMFNWGGGSIRTYARQGLLADLTEHLESDPEWKDSFLPSVLDAGKIDGKYFGIPMRTMQPKLLFYNTAVMEDVGVEPPETWDQFLDVADKISSAGITPVALAGATNWTMLMWIEYLTDRIGGSRVFADIAAGKDRAWRHPAVTEAVDTIRDMVDRGVFGSNFASVSWDGGAVQALLSEGKAAMHLMGSWEYTEQLGAAPEFVKESLGWSVFPAFDDGEGDPKAVVGNPTNYFSLTADSPHTEAGLQYLKTMSSKTYVDDLISVGDVPAVDDIADRVANADNAEYASFIYDISHDAPSFQLSWDQAVEREQADPLLVALEQVFLGELDADGFISANEDAAA